MASPALSPALAGTWQRYRTWALTARELKAELDRWRLWTLILAVVGAVLVTLGQQLGALTATFGAGAVLVGRVIGLGGAGAIALAAYFARESLGHEAVQAWTKCRSTAESLKANAYIYRVGAAPFDGADRDQKLLERRAAIEEAGEGVEVREATTEDRALDLSPLSTADYVQQRVNDQIQFYRTRSDEYQKKTKRLRRIVLWLGAAAVVLGVVSAIRPMVAGWTAVIATITAALTSHVQSERYQNLITTYQSTARRLETLKDKWEASGKTDSDSRNAFIQSCEDTMASENSAWVTQWAQQKAPAQKPSISG